MASQPPPDPPNTTLPAFNNSGHGPLLVPGAGLPPFLDDVPWAGAGRFAQAYDYKEEWPMRATSREIAMLRCMARITDKPNWQRDVFSDDTVAAWKAEARAANWLISDKAWAWCVAEMRDKAERSVETGRTVVLEYGWGAVCKVDLDGELPGALRKAVDAVVERVPSKGLARPDGVAHIVDAHLAPLVYDKTRVLVDGGAVGREDMDDWYGRGVPLGRAEGERERYHVMGTLSPAFQWLPCEVALDPAVRITSYINDLHPHQQADAYPVVERAVAVAIESWNEVLARVDPSPACDPAWVNTGPLPGRTPPRIRTFGVQYPFGLPAWEKRLWVAEDDAEATADVLASLPSLEDEVSRGEVGSRAEVLSAFKDPEWNYIFLKDEVTHLIHPEPGVSFSYDEWKEGRNVTRAIVPRPPPSIVPRPPPSEEPDVQEPEVKGPDAHRVSSVSLQDEFRDAGLQVVVQVNSIELTPTKPRWVDGFDHYTEEEWHAADGMATDYIAATSILFFDLDNVQPVGVRFRQPVHLCRWDFAEAEHEDFKCIMEVFDLGSQTWLVNLCQPLAFPSLQEMGHAVATEGRMLSFPGPVSYRFEPMELADASRPGRARYLVVHLVDPNYRVCSTRNVPPQRLDWWAYDVARKASDALRRLPRELLDEIVAGAADTDGILDAGEMEEAREAMKQERRDNADIICDRIGYHRFCDDPDDIMYEDQDM